MTPNNHPLPQGPSDRARHSSPPAADAPDDDVWADPPEQEPLRDGGGHLLDLVAAVDYFAHGARHDFTVWDALEEALRWWLTDQAALATGMPAGDLHDPPDGDADPLRTQLRRLVDYADNPDTATQAAEALQQALRRWVETMADRYNAGFWWPHPMARRGFPPPRTHR